MHFKMMHSMVCDFILIFKNAVANVVLQDGQHNLVESCPKCLGLSRCLINSYPPATGADEGSRVLMSQGGVEDSWKRSYISPG